jgi:hypothetical protein
MIGRKLDVKKEDAGAALKAATDGGACSAAAAEGKHARSL